MKQKSKDTLMHVLVSFIFAIILWLYYLGIIKLGNAIDPTYKILLYVLASLPGFVVISFIAVLVTSRYVKKISPTFIGFLLITFYIFPSYILILVLNILMERSLMTNIESPGLLMIVTPFILPWMYSKWKKMFRK